MKKIIVTADDYGAHEYIDRGITIAAEAGCINTASCIVTFSRAEESIKRFIAFCKKKNIEINLGIHLSLTAGKPLLGNEVNSLISKDQEFMNVNYFDYDKINPFEVYYEANKQIETLKNIVENEGLKLDHITSHHGIMTLFPDFLKIYLLLAAKYALPVRNPILISREKIWGFRSSPMKREGMYRGFKILQNEGADQVLINASTISVKSLKSNLHVFNNGIARYPDHFIDTFYKNGSKKRLKKILKYLPDSQKSEMVVHLGSGEYKDTPQERELYNGINFDYFEGRLEELKTIINELNLKNYVNITSSINLSGYNN